MSDDHQIRLRGPWQLFLVHGGADSRLEAFGRFEAPAGLADRLPEHYEGLVRLERSFHRPTGLDSQSQVRLRIFTNLNGQLRLNDLPMGPVACGDNLFTITPHLQTRNRICVEVVIDASTAMRQPSCEARLEIIA